MAEKSSCCVVSRYSNKSSVTPASIVPARSSRDFDTVPIPAGMAIVGTKKPQIPDDGEGPLRKKRVQPFLIAPTTVTNRQFQDFVDATGYVTEAERLGWSFVFWKDVPPSYGPTEAVPGLEWWRPVDGANWREINGPKTYSACLSDHPVVQVSWKDALAYVSWVGGRLPTEAEWEHAARGGAGDVRYPWGETEPNDNDFTPCNIWQGRFPRTNTERDGYARTAPVKSFEPNRYGLYQTMGNVWEWTADPFTIQSLKKTVQARLKQIKGYRVSKGGSFLCHRSYCYRYRIAARIGVSPDSSAPHQGFRVVWDN